MTSFDKVDLVGCFHSCFRSFLPEFFLFLSGGHGKSVAGESVVVAVVALAVVVFFSGCDA